MEEGEGIADDWYNLESNLCNIYSVLKQTLLQIQSGADEFLIMGWYYMSWQTETVCFQWHVFL